VIEILKTIQSESIEKINEVNSLHDLDQLKSFLLGKKSPLMDVLKDIPNIPVEERPVIGKEANKLKQDLTQRLTQKRQEIVSKERDLFLKNNTTDITLPTAGLPLGSYHPITLITRRVCSLLNRYGYAIKQGPNIESDFHNFEALNIGPNHPARDMHDTFYLKNKQVLRTHTSPVQIRTMIEQKPPIKMIAPGKVYRCDADISHSPVFHQVEGLYVDKGVTFGDLKGTLESFLRELFGQDHDIRFRSSYFPFTEPSVEVDVSYTIGGKTTWLEIMGAGMVQRNIFRNVSYDPDEYTGFAFGLGIERIAMILYQIDNIRLFYENDYRFLNQF
jgi:phenylalanyl-tRNA synthetase alpha chain